MNDESEARNLAIYVVYGPNTSDFPGQYLIRRQVAKPNCIEIDANLYASAPTLEEIRDKLPPGLVCIDRDPNDDPVILETWL